MKPRKGESDFDPFEGLTDDPFAMVSREVLNRSGLDEEMSAANQEKRLPRPSMARARFEHPIGHGENKR